MNEQLLSICQSCCRRFSQTCTLSRSPVYQHVQIGLCPEARFPLHNSRRLRRDVRCQGPIRVGLASYGHYVGGVEEWFRCLVAGNADPEITYTAIGVTDPEQIGGATPEGIPLIPLAELHQHVDLILGWSTDLTHLANWPGRIVYVAHGQSSWTASCVQRHVPIADAVVAVSQSSRGVISAPDDWVTVIRNGVDLDRLPDRHERNVTEPTIGYLGRWDVDKRPHLAAETAARLRCRAAYLVPDHHLAQAERSLRGFFSRIDWYDTARLREFLSRISLLIIPSSHEGGPLVAAEAWAAGVPVAATSVGMIPELEQQHGPLVIPLSNPPTSGELAAALEQIDPAAVDRAYTLARQELTKERMSSEYSAVFRRLFGRL